MVILHICPISDDLSNGVHVAVPCHVKAQRKFADAALWNPGQPVKIDGLEQNYNVSSLDELPPPYRRPDLAVFHEVYIPRYISIAKQLKKLGIPYIVFPHGSLKKSAQKKSRIKKIPANLLLFRPFCDNAAGIQCLTEAEKAESVMGKRLFVAPNGVEQPENIKTAFNGDRMKFVYVGRILPSIKGLDLMIKAFSLEKEFLESHGCTLDIYGPEDRGMSFVPELQALAQQLGVSGSVRLHPAVFGEEKQKVLLDADVFIQTSRTEAMPMGVLEALSLGLPCVVSEGTGFARIIEQNGAGWNAGSSAETIAAAVKHAANDIEKLGDISKKAAALSHNYGWDAAAETAVDQYKACMDAAK